MSHLGFGINVNLLSSLGQSSRGPSHLLAVIGTVHHSGGSERQVVKKFFVFIELERSSFDLLTVRCHP